jgi:hypothetical protein
VAFEKLLPTGDYMLVETKTNPGYQLPLGQWLIQVEVGQAPEISITARGDHLPPAFAPDGSGGLAVINYPLFAMPRAGMSSFTLLLATAGGAALLGGAGFFAFGGIRRKRKLLSK